MKVKSLLSQFSGVKRTHVRQGTVGQSFDVTLLFPVVEVPYASDLGGVLHPLDHLQHRHKIDIVLASLLIDEFDEFFLEVSVAFQPSCLEVETERSTIGAIVSLEVVFQEVSELGSFPDVRTRINKVTPRKALVEEWVITSVQLIHDHLPDGMRPGRTVLGISMALVWHSEIHCIWPKG